MRTVGHGQHEIRKFHIQFRDLLVGLLDFLRDLLHLGQQCGDILAGFFHARNFLAGFVALRLQSLGEGNSFAALLIDGAKGGEIDGHAAIGGHLLEFFQMFAKISQFMHGQ